METVSTNHLFHSISLAEPAGFLFLLTILRWVSRTLQKLSLRFSSLLHFNYVKLFASSSVVPGGQPTKNTPCEDTYRRELEVSRDDVEMVIMRRMGLQYSSQEEDNSLTEYMGSDELSRIFDEEEPSLGEVKEAFCVFDQNNDGFIDAVELQRVLSVLGFREGLALDACKRMIAVHDEDQDGRMDFINFVKLMEISFS